MGSFIITTFLKATIMEGNADFVFFSKWLHEAHSWSRLSALLSTAASVREIRRTNTNCCCVSAVIKLQPRGSHSLVAGCEYIQTVFLLIGADVECFPCNKSSCIFLRAELHPPPPLQLSARPFLHHHHTHVGSLILILSVHSCLTLREEKPIKWD